MRILVADDNPDSRELMLEVLASRGHSAAAARDGREALAALAKEHFELVFMDEEMPAMGGIETTRAIHEMSAPGRRPIIIGMSGNVAAIDERRCLEAGMDAFLGKPVGVAEITSVLEFFRHRLKPVDAQEPQGPRQSSESENLSGHLQQMSGGDAKILKTLVGNFLADAPKKLSALRNAYAQKDSSALASAAHAAKGSLATIGAKKAAELAGDLQRQARTGNLQGAEVLISGLESEFTCVDRALRALPIAAKAPRPASRRKPAAVHHKSQR